MLKNKKHIYLIAIFVLINAIATQVNYRVDFTRDSKYSISSPTKNLLKNLKNPVYITVYLTGDLPYDFERLEKETAYFLNDLKNNNSNINYGFVNPKNSQDFLTKQGLTPSKLTVQENGKISKSIIFPWATIKKDNKVVAINLLKNSNFGTETTQIENSVQNLEFAFTNGIQKIIAKKKQKIAILRGNGELSDIHQYDFLKTLGQNYKLAPFTLDSVANQPQKTLQQLQDYDLAIISKPTKAFTEEEKFTLDQFTINGGKTLWLLDLVNTSKDSLMQSGKVLSYQRDLNLTDYLFNYGIRINKHLVRDLYAAKIPLAVGKVGNKTQFDEFLWDYYPVLKTNNKHVINKGIGDVKLEFANSIDTLKSGIHKTILLESSKLTKTVNVPNYINLESIAKNDPINTFNHGTKTFAILLEGNFNSAYKNRVKPFQNSFKAQTKNGKMVVISDGDIASNQISKGKPLELGLDKWTNAYYANKEFLTNTVHYLLNDNGLIQLRAKRITIDAINKPKAHREKTKWQVINIIIPLVFILFLGILNFYYRKIKY